MLLILLFACVRDGGQLTPAASDATGQPDASPPGSEPLVAYERSGGIAGQGVSYLVFADGRVLVTRHMPDGEQQVTEASVEAEAVDRLIHELDTAGYFGLDGQYLPEDTCCDRFAYTLTVRTDDGTHTIEALEATPDVPVAVWNSIGVVERFVFENVPQGDDVTR